MKYLEKKNKGMTLIEIVVSIALIGIIAMAFFPMLSFGFKDIVAAGNKSKVIYQSQNQSENKLSTGASNTSTTITINFTGSSPITIDTPGEKVINGSIQMFVPK